jgi:hypothetical protein
MFRDPSQEAYCQSVGTSTTNRPVFDKRDPTPNDIYYPLGKFWVNQVGLRLWYLNSQSNVTGTLQSLWIEVVATSSTALLTLSDTANNVVFPSTATATPPNDIQLIGANGVTVSANLPSPPNSSLTIALPPSTQGQIFSGNGVNTPIFSKTVTGLGTWTFTNQFLVPDVGNVVLALRNADNSSTSSYADIQASVVADSIADPFLLVAVEAVTNYCFGIQNNGSFATNYLVINRDAPFVTPSTGFNLWKLYPSGARVMISQPCFLAYLSSTQTNVSGDGTVYHVPFDTIVFDQDSHFTTGAGALFTAQVTGRYSFTASVTTSAAGAGSGFIYLLDLVATSRTLRFSWALAAGTSLANNMAFQNTGIIDMTAGDTLYVNITISSGAKTNSILGSGSPYFTYISGKLDY